MAPEDEVDAMLREMGPDLDAVQKDFADDFEEYFFGAEGFGEAWPC